MDYYNDILNSQEITSLEIKIIELEGLIVRLMGSYEDAVNCIIIGSELVRANKMLNKFKQEISDKGCALL